MQWLLSGGNGGSGYTDDVGTYTIDSAANVETFSWLKDELVGKDLTGPVAPGKLNRADAFAAFADGQVGMLNGHPTLIQQAEKKGVKFGMVPMPGRTGKARASMGVADWMMAFKQNGHADQIGDFLDFVYTEKNVLDFSRTYGLLPVTGSASNTMAASGRARRQDPAPVPGAAAHLRVVPPSARPPGRRSARPSSRTSARPSPPAAAPPAS